MGYGCAVCVILESEQPMGNEQLYVAIGIPCLFNAALFALLLGHINSRFTAVDKRLDDLRDLWRAELRRVEEV